MRYLISQIISIENQPKGFLNSLYLHGFFMHECGSTAVEDHVKSCKNRPQSGLCTIKDKE